MNSHSTLFRGWIADAILSIFCVVCFLHVRSYLVDDSFIAFRYAANLVQGQGLVFSAGERVEGFSDLSWTLLMAVPEVIHMRPELFAIAISVLSAIAAFVLSRRTMVSCFGIEPFTALVLTVLAAFNAHFWIMTGNGIESAFYSLVLVAGFALLARKRFAWAGALLGFATTVRPESLVIAPLTVGLATMIAFARTRKREEVLREALRFRSLLLVWSLIVLSILAWRFTYYGAWIPNTVLAKAHPLHRSDLREGADYVIRFALRNTPILAPALVAVFLNAPSALLIGLSWIAFQMGVVIMNSGDWMSGFRLLSVYIPLLAIAAAFGVDRCFTARIWRQGAILALACASCAIQFASGRWNRESQISTFSTRSDMMHDNERIFMELATALRPALGQGDRICPDVLGAFAYMLPEVRMHDWLGLADSHIARHGALYFPKYGKADPKYSAEVVAPDLFLMLYGDSIYSLFQRETDGAFARRYRCWVVTNRPNRVLFAVRRDREEAMLAAIRNSPLQLEPLVPLN